MKGCCFKPTTEFTVATVLGHVSAFVSSAVSWVGSFVGAITSNPLLLCFVIVAFVGLGIGLLKRLVRV